MLIAQDDSSCNDESQTDKVSITGNIVPSSWYHSLVRECGKSDTNAITILSELVFLHRLRGNTEFQLNFTYFSKKFNFGLSQVKDAVVRLEQNGLVKRSLQTIIISGRKFSNEMFLILNINNVLKLTKGINGGASGTQVKKFPPSNGKSNEPTAEISSDNIDKKDLSKEYRSKGSNFVSNSFSSKHNALASTVIQKQRFSLASFYPLLKPDIDKLQMLCGREFSANAINEILQSLSFKLPNHTFPHKAAFLKYMGKALTYEMRDAVKISNESFKIQSNATVEEIEAKIREEFLSKIENSRDTSYKMQLSRKLAGILEPSLAHRFLKSASFVDNIESSKIDFFKISLSEKLELGSSELGHILTQVQSVYGNHIKRLEIILSQEVETIIAQDVPTTRVSFRQFNSLLPAESKPLEGIWGRVRQGLIDYYGSSGKAMDQSWFSKLKADIDIEGKKLILTAPTRFIKDWVQSNYSHLIDTLCRVHSYSLGEVIAV